MTSSNSSVLAGLIGDSCVQGFKYSGTAAGKTIMIAGVQTYLSEPPADAANVSEPKKVIMFFADVFGPFYENAQLLQDFFASNGFYVLGIDYFFGDPVQNHEGEEGFDRAAWSAKSRKQAAEHSPAWIQSVREKYGNEAKYNAVGYCFGAPYVLEVGSTDNVVSVAFAHPSALNEDHFERLTKPILLSCAEVDQAFPRESRRKAEDILVKKQSTYHVQVFSGVSHGFATRGDPAVENSRWAREESARSVVRWFKRFSASS